jgi:hypothetical protein
MRQHYTASFSMKQHQTAINKTGLTTFYNHCATCIVLIPIKMHRSWYAPCACFFGEHVIFIVVNVTW